MEDPVIEIAEGNSSVPKTHPEYAFFENAARLLVASGGDLDPKDVEAVKEALSKPLP